MKNLRCPTLGKSKADNLLCYNS